LNRVFEEKKPDVVVNFAAETHVDRSIRESGSFLKTNLFGTYLLLEMIKKYKTSRFVQVSTDEVYGSIPRGSCSEDAPLSPSSPYSASKAGADLLVLSYFKTYSLPVIITRSSNNFGPMQFPEKFIPRLLTNALLGKNLPIFGSGKNVRDWIYVKDNCRAINLVLHKGQVGEIYNIGAGNKRTNLEIVKEIQKRFPNTKIEFVADRPGHDLRYSLNIEKIKKLGFIPKYSLQDAMEETIDWYRQNRWWWEPLKAKSEAIYKDWGKDVYRH